MFAGSIWFTITLVMNDVIAIILIVLLMLVAMIFIPQYMTRRAVLKVLRIFRQQNAIGMKNARTVDELGLRPRSMLQSIGRGRDYKSKALEALIRADVVQMTEDGRLYLSEDKAITAGVYKQ